MSAVRPPARVAWEKAAGMRANSAEPGREQPPRRMRPRSVAARNNRVASKGEPGKVKPLRRCQRWELGDRRRSQSGRNVALPRAIVEFWHVERTEKDAGHARPVDAMAGGERV